MSKTLGARPGFENLTRPVSGLKSVLQTVARLNCTLCLVRQAFHASRGATRVRAVWTTPSVPKGMSIPFHRPGDGHTSLARCVKRLLICNRFTSAMGACFPMVLPTHRMGVAGRDQRNASYKVKQIMTDKGGEFINDAIAHWYKAHGIEHVKVGPKSSQLILCERTHQSLVAMTKAAMYQA